MLWLSEITSSKSTLSDELIIVFLQTSDTNRFIFSYYLNGLVRRIFKEKKLRTCVADVVWRFRGNIDKWRWTKFQQFLNIPVQSSNNGNKIDNVTESLKIFTRFLFLDWCGIWHQWLKNFFLSRTKSLKICDWKLWSTLRHIESLEFVLFKFNKQANFVD